MTRTARSNRLTLIALVSVALAGAWYVRRGSDGAGPEGGTASPARGEDPTLLLDRLWIDSKPEKYTDYAHVMITVSAAPFGIFQKASAYRATTELYEYSRKDHKLTVLFPQSGKRRTIKYRIRACDELPPFDLCLDLGENPWGGPRRYYGLADPDQEAELLGEIRHRAEHHLPGQ